jgi:preprotein translocase subunit SecE
MSVKSDSDGVPDGDEPEGTDVPAGRDDASEAARQAADDSADLTDPSDPLTDDVADDAEFDRLVREELEPARAGARVSAGSARAAARASAARTGVTPSKGRPTKARDQGPKRGNIFVRIVRYLREVVSEMRKVIWPTRKEMITYSIVVIIFLVFMVAMTWALDLGFARAVLAIFG